MRTQIGIMRTSSETIKPLMHTNQMAHDHKIMNSVMHQQYQCVRHEFKVMKITLTGVPNADAKGTVLQTN